MAQYPEFRTTKTATIASGEALSGAVDLQGVVVVGLLMPSAWTAADITFQASPDGVTYGEVYKAQTGSAYSESVAAGAYIPLHFETLWSVRYLKVRSGTSDTAVNQAAARELTLVVRPA